MLRYLDVCDQKSLKISSAKKFQYKYQHYQHSQMFHSQASFSEKKAQMLLKQNNKSSSTYFGNICGCNLHLNGSK